MAWPKKLSGVHGRVLDCLGKAGERCLRRAILGVTVPEAGPQQRIEHVLVSFTSQLRRKESA